MRLLKLFLSITAIGCIATQPTLHAQQVQRNVLDEEFTSWNCYYCVLFDGANHPAGVYEYSLSRNTGIATGLISLAMQ